MCGELGERVCVMSWEGVCSKHCCTVSQNYGEDEEAALQAVLQASLHHQ